MSEDLIVNNVYQRLIEDESITACREVPVLGRFVDLAYIKGRTVVAIEFKISNWRKAVQQSRDHKLGADFAYICMPRRIVTDKMRKEILAAGVGLKFYCEEGDWPFEEIIPAPRSKDVWKVARLSVKEYVKENQDDFLGKI
jgi:hypothetical protein